MLLNAGGYNDQDQMFTDGHWNRSTLTCNLWFVFLSHKMKKKKKKKKEDSLKCPNNDLKVLTVQSHYVGTAERKTPILNTARVGQTHYMPLPLPPLPLLLIIIVSNHCWEW